MVHPLERFGWVIASIASGIGLITWVIGNISLTYKIIATVIFVIVLILASIWHKIRKDQKSDVTKYDTKKLNKNIFRKLTRAEFHHDYYGNLTFKIPINDMAFTPKNSGAYMHWIFETNTHDRDSHFSPIENVIPDLVIGEKYLKSSYPKVYKKWEEVTKLVDEHNENHEEFLNKLGESFEKQFNPQFPDFKEEEETEQNFWRHAYVLRKIKKILYRSILNISEDSSDFTFSQMNMQQSSVDSNYWVVNYRSDTIIVTDDKDKIDIEKLRGILTRIVNDGEIRNDFHKTYFIENSEWDKLTEFQNMLEDEVVKDIDNQV